MRNLLLIPVLLIGCSQSSPIAVVQVPKNPPPNAPKSLETSDQTEDVVKLVRKATAVIESSRGPDGSDVESLQSAKLSLLNIEQELRSIAHQTELIVDAVEYVDVLQSMVAGRRRIADLIASRPPDGSDAITILNHTERFQEMMKKSTSDFNDTGMRGVTVVDKLKRHIPEGAMIGREQFQKMITKEADTPE